ncbi:uncharacterized protein LOC112490225 [Ziziphus jujuba]|uniref:Uncharacterized protein LOC112490225 n=1 Tax=Ziziphus jujuba TaxID=326968 RepID=A0A6P6FUS2_ZIZJJ|nr:uncharacterized protein LOC112490225 [Ziziphus jujuba]
MDMKIYGRLAVAAAPFVLLYSMPYKTHVLVKVVLTLLWLSCLRQLPRILIMFRPDKDSFRESLINDLSAAGDPGTKLKSHFNAMASQTVPQKPIELKLSINKKSNQVLYAECNTDFVNVLLSFLTLPMGKIVRLADKKSGIGSMDDMYKSVEHLDEEYFWTKAGKTMLLDPRSAYGLQCSNLVVKIDQTDYSKLYICGRSLCLALYLGLGYFSLVKDSVCTYCGQVMDNEIFLQNEGELIGRSFISNEINRYIIRDDLKVLPASMDYALSWLRRQNIRDSTDVKVKIVNIGENEVLHLLHRSMISKTPLTDVLLLKDRNYVSNSLRVPYHQYLRRQGLSSNKMMVKLWFSKSTKKVICIEAEEGFVNFLFTFLTLPLGAIINMLKGKSSMGSVHKLYESAKELSEMKIINREYKEMLLSPKLERMFGCSYQLLQIQEQTIPSSLVYNNCSCWRFQQIKACEHFKPTLQIVNPKWPSRTTGGAFIKGCKLLVTDNLEIKPLSTVSDIHKLGRIPFEDMESMTVNVGEEEALNLLQASLISKSVLSHAFSSQVINRK